MKSNAKKNLIDIPYIIFYFDSWKIIFRYVSSYKFLDKYFSKIILSMY